MLRCHVNRFQTGVTSGSRSSKTNDKKKFLYLFKILTFICKKIEAIKLILLRKKILEKKRLR